MGQGDDSTTHYTRWERALWNIIKILHVHVLRENITSNRTKQPSSAGSITSRLKCPPNSNIFAFMQSSSARNISTHMFVKNLESRVFPCVFMQQQKAHVPEKADKKTTTTSIDHSLVNMKYGNRTENHGRSLIKKIHGKATKKLSLLQWTLRELCCGHEELVLPGSWSFTKAWVFKWDQKTAEQKVYSSLGWFYFDDGRCSLGTSSSSWPANNCKNSW